MNESHWNLRLVEESSHTQGSVQCSTQREYIYVTLPPVATGTVTVLTNFSSTGALGTHVGSRWSRALLRTCCHELCRGPHPVISSAGWVRRAHWSNFTAGWSRLGRVRAGRGHQLIRAVVHHEQDGDRQDKQVGQRASRPAAAVATT